MARAVLTAEDRAQLLGLMRRQMNSHVHRRMNVLLLLDDGWTAERIAEALFIDAETVHEHRRRYETPGVAGLERLHYQGSEPMLSAAQFEALKPELDVHLYMTPKAVCDFVKCRFEVAYMPKGRGVYQPIFSSPARPQPWVPSRIASCAAPPS